MKMPCLHPERADRTGTALQQESAKRMAILRGFRTSVKLVSALAAICLLWLSEGCGSDGDEVFLDGGAAMSGVDVATGERRDRGTAVISISKLDGQFVYRIHEDRLNESELRRLAANMAAFSPNVPVILVPGPALTSDETQLVRARLMEEGLRDVRVVTDRQP